MYRSRVAFLPSAKFSCVFSFIMRAQVILPFHSPLCPFVAPLPRRAPSAVQQHQTTLHTLIPPTLPVNSPPPHLEAGKTENNAGKFPMPLQADSPPNTSLHSPACLGLARRFGVPLLSLLCEFGRVVPCRRVRLFSLVVVPVLSSRLPWRRFCRPLFCIVATLGSLCGGVPSCPYTVVPPYN